MTSEQEKRLREIEKRANELINRGASARIFPWDLVRNVPWLIALAREAEKVTDLKTKKCPWCRPELIEIVECGYVGRLRKETNNG